MNKLANIHTYDTYVRFQAADYTVTFEHRSQKGADQIPHYQLYKNCLALLARVGFVVGEDANIIKNYPVLSNTHDYGIWRGLEFKSHIYPNGFDFQFYQDVTVAAHPAGGEYEYGKYPKMPYLTRKAFDYAKQALVAFIGMEAPCTTSTADSPKEAVAHILHHAQTKSFTRNGIQSLSEIEGLMSKYDHERNSFGRDKELLKCGQIKYFYDYANSRLSRGIVYHNINNMWWVITDRFGVRNIGSYQLFDPTPADYARRRIKKGAMPAHKKAQLDLLASISPAQLAKALSQRKRATPATREEVGA